MTRAWGLSPSGWRGKSFKNRQGWKAWIAEEAGWVAMLEDHNRTAHTYDKALAKDVYRRFSGYLPLFRALERALRMEHL